MELLVSDMAVVYLCLAQGYKNTPIKAGMLKGSQFHQEALTQEILMSDDLVRFGGIDLA